MPKNLTRKGEEQRQKILLFIREYIEKHAYPPTYREIAEGCGIRAASTILNHLRILEAQDKVKTQYGKVRTIVLLDNSKNRGQR